jgi:aminoglycoside phosphotransferase (APT) family kinase protein
MAMDEIRRAVGTHLPAHADDDLVRLGGGSDNVAYALGGLVLRHSREPDREARAEAVRREALLLELVAEASPLPVPRPVFADPALGVLAYAELPGVPLLDLPAEVRRAAADDVAGRLGELLAALHAVPHERVAGLAGIDDDPPSAWLAEAAEVYARIEAGVPATYRPLVEAFLRAGPPARGDAVVFSHNDLGIEHVLVDAATLAVTGVIDWSDAALTDPAADLGLLLRDLGPAALETALATGGFPAADGTRERSAFYARCSVLEDLAYGLETPGAARYAEKSRDSLAWLFTGGHGRGWSH